MKSCRAHIGSSLVQLGLKVLVAILKQEWPHNWPTFISDICDASKVRWRPSSYVGMSLGSSWGVLEMDQGALETSVLPDAWSSMVD